MSIKVAAFAKIITQPLNLYNFNITFDYSVGTDVKNDLDRIMLVVQSTSFPSEKLRKIELYSYGEVVRYPTLPENEGSWKIKIPENDNGDIRSILDSLKTKIYDQKSGALTPPNKTTITVTSKDMADGEVFSVDLHGCWIQGRDSVELSSNNVTDSWNWDYNFVFDWIEDKGKIKRQNTK